MDPARLRTLLSDVSAGRVSVAEGLRALAALPLVDVGHSRVDTHRALRCGAPEVVFGEGKTTAEILDVGAALVAQHERLLVTRVGAETAGALLARWPAAHHFPRSRVVALGLPAEETGAGAVTVVSAGTADGAVAEEAAITARFLGARVERVSDVGVAGIHRLLAETERLRAARVLVVVAGMEGALPSVVGGLVEVPVIAVPTSVGYGASFGGIAALLAMLNACAAGVTVVNIDNGFGAGYAAAMINRQAAG